MPRHTVPMSWDSRTCQNCSLPAKKKQERWRNQQRPMVKHWRGASVSCWSIHDASRALKDKKWCPSRSCATATQTSPRCLQRRKSTSSCKIFYGEHLLKSTSTTQAVSRVPKLNSPQQSRQQLREVVAFQWCVILEEFCNNKESKSKRKGFGDGIDSPSLEIKLDATAGRAIAMRRGAGRIRRIATPTLWLQRFVINGDTKMTRVGGCWLGNITFGLPDNEQALEVLRNASCGRPEQDCTLAGILLDIDSDEQRSGWIATFRYSTAWSKAWAGYGKPGLANCD